MFLLCFLERNGGFCLVGLLSREAGVLRHSQINNNEAGDEPVNI